MAKVLYRAGTQADVHGFKVDMVTVEDDDPTDYESDGWVEAPADTVDGGKKSKAGFATTPKKRKPAQKKKAD